MSVGKFTWKTYGISLNDLKYNTLPAQFLEYEEMMFISSDYDRANYEDSKPKK